jgi:hypothetical protein
MLNPVIAMMLVAGLFGWMAFRPHSTGPVKIFLLIAAWMLFGPISEAVLNAETAAIPLKFDYFLQLLDEALGISAFFIARLFSERQLQVLFFVYQTMGYWMILLYALHLKLKDGRPKQLLICYLMAYGLAPLFYLIVPACGPRHAFGALFPTGTPEVGPILVNLTFWPNAIPSLHLATAIILLHYTGRSLFLQSLGWVNLIGTAAATLAFEHYLIDLVLAVPYAYFVIWTAEGKFQRAILNLAIVLVWLVSIRFGTPQLIKYPPLLQLLAISTVAAGAYRWSLRLAPIRGASWHMRQPYQRTYGNQ